MEFTNSQIHIRNIAQIEDIEFEPLQPSYRRVQLYFNIIFFSVLLIGGSFVAWALEPQDRIFAYGAIGFVFLIFIISLLLIDRSFKVKGLAVRMHDVIYKRGLIFRKITSIPFNRIQHVELNQGPIEKQFGLGRLEIYTAGGAASDLKIPGLKYEEAKSLRAYIIQKTMQDEEE